MSGAESSCFASVSETFLHKISMLFSSQFSLDPRASSFVSCSRILESSMVLLERLKFPQSFPIFHILPLYGNFGNFPKNCKDYQNLMNFSTQISQTYHLTILSNIKSCSAHFPNLKDKGGISVKLAYFYTFLGVKF